MHTCARLTTGTVRCWGWGGTGSLGYGNENAIGDDEPPSSAGDVRVGGPVTQIATAHHTCALLSNGAVRCWGYSEYGRLGYPGVQSVGVATHPESAGDVDVGGAVAQIALGERHTCALLVGGAVRCWGSNFNGQLGYGFVRDVGDDETPATVGDVNVGGRVTQIAAGNSHTCALLSTGAVRCWGMSQRGQLGYGDTRTLGDDETPADVGDVPVGGTVRAIAAGGVHTCALLSTGNVRCWGYAEFGQLGYGNRDDIGNDEPASAGGDVDVGGSVQQIVTGGAHTCALLSGGRVRCWGKNAENPNLCRPSGSTCGNLGYAHLENIGDNELPKDAGDVLVR